jgi:hypothetical protein
VEFSEPELEEIVVGHEDWVKIWELAISQGAYDIWSEATNDIKHPAEEYLEAFWKTITWDKEGRPTVALPRNKEFSGKLTTNQRVGAQRARRVVAMLNKGDKRAINYANVVEDMISQFMEEVDYPGLVASGEPYCELPHHAVYREGSSTELRVVFDGSAHDPGCLSLNDFFYVGPNLLPKIQDILTRVKTYAAVAIADIKKAFMQVGVPPEDRNYLLFRWHRKDKRGKWRECWYRFKRLPWGLICSPFVLNAVIRYLFKLYGEKHPQYKEILDNLAQNTYVDDLVAGANEPATAIAHMRVAVAALAEGKMVLTKFKGIPASIGDELAGSPTPRDFKLLGINVKSEQDLICPATGTLQAYAKKNTLIKKEAAGMTNGVFDPLGQAAPTTLLAKFLWQDFMEKHQSVCWTYRLPQEDFLLWKGYWEKAEKLSELWFPG